VFAQLTEGALCGCDLIPCVESGQYDPRAVEEGDPRAEVIWQAEPTARAGFKARGGHRRARATTSGDRDWGLPMQVTVKGKNTAVPEKLRVRAERKLTKLERFDARILAMDVEFSEERNPRVADPHRVEVTLTTKSGLLRAHANATDPAAAVDQVVHRLERQVKKLKGRQVDRTQHADAAKTMPPPSTPEATEEPPGDQDETDQAKVVYRRGDGGAVGDEPTP
jgi:ribosomal subunit interface protein